MRNYEHRIETLERQANVNQPKIVIYRPSPEGPRHWTTNELIDSEEFENATLRIEYSVLGTESVNGTIVGAQGFRNEIVAK